MILFSVCLVAATFLWPALAMSGAPGDFQDVCTRHFPDPIPQGHRVIFDTWSYEKLFDGILATLNDDGGSGWIAGSGGSCREQLRVCDYTQSTQPQNNWVFTQFINYLEATEVFVNVSYHYINCTRNMRRECNTLHTTVYTYELEESDSNNGRTSPANYDPLAILGLEDGQGSGEEMFTFLPSHNDDGFYLGIKDTGTCGSIERITVYYRVIPSRTDGLIEYPEIPLPPVRSSDRITRVASCAVDSTGSNLELTANSGRVVEGNPSCLCNPGYQFESLVAECTACRPGEYKASHSNDIPCQACPANSFSEEPATDVCTCDFGFARPPSEPDEPCTKLPSSPKLAIYFPPLIDGSDVKTCWLPSIDRGGRDDFHYNIYALELGSNEFKRINKEEILPSNEDQNDEDPICYTLSVERERSSFTIVVVATNGAANDPNTINDISIVQDRFIAFYIATCPGSLPPILPSEVPDPPVPCPSCPEIECPSCPTVQTPSQYPTPTCSPCPETTCPVPPTRGPETPPSQTTIPVATPPPTLVVPPSEPTCSLLNLSECSYEYCAGIRFKKTCLLRQDGCGGGTACQVAHCRSCYQGELSNFDVESALSACSSRECSSPYRRNCVKTWGTCIQDRAGIQEPVSSNGFKCIPHACI